jgi:hypothetical protein
MLLARSQYKESISARFSEASFSTTGCSLSEFLPRIEICSAFSKAFLASGGKASSKPFLSYSDRDSMLNAGIELV